MKYFELSGRFCLHNKAVVLSQDESSVNIGLCNENEIIKEKINKVFNRRKGSDTQSLVFSMIDESIWHREVSKLLSKDLIGTQQNVPTLKKSSEAEEAPVINLLNSLIIECLLQNGSDAHIEYCKNDVRIRYRVFGFLYEQMHVSVEVADALIQRIKLLSKLELAEKRRAQDGRFDFFHKDFNVDVRVSCVPSYFGESVVLRFLNRNAQLLHLKKLGFNGSQLRQLNKI